MLYQTGSEMPRMLLQLSFSMHAASTFTPRIYSSPLARPGTSLYRRNFEVSQAEASTRRATSALRQTKTDNDFVVLRGGSAEVYDNERKTPPIEFSEDGKLLLFGVEAVAEVWAIALVYFVQGILDISVLAESFYYKDTLHLGPAELSMISSIALLPWVMKPFYGFISDSFPLFGYRRRSYLILSGLLSSASWAGMSALASCDFSPATSYPALWGLTPTWAAVSLVTASSLGLAFSDVLVDAIVVTRSRDHTSAASLQSLCWSSSAIGSILSAYASGSLVQHLGPSRVFALTSLFPLVTAAVGAFINETPVRARQTRQTRVRERPPRLPATPPAEAEGEDAVEESVGNTLTQQLGETAEESVANESVANTPTEQFVLLRNALSHKSVLYPVLFLFFWQATPTSGSALFYFQTNKLGFRPEFLGRLSLISAVASLGGVVLYDQYLKHVPLRSILKWCSLAGVILGMSPVLLVTHANRQMGLPDEMFALGDNLVLSVLASIAWMPLGVLAARICPKSIEATFYSSLMSISNLASALGSMSGGAATRLLGVTESDFTNLPLLIIGTSLAGLLPLPFLSLISDEPQNQNGPSKCAGVSESRALASESTTSKAPLPLDETDETEKNKSREQSNLI